MLIHSGIDWERVSLISAMDGYNVIEAIQMFDSLSARTRVENIINSRGNRCIWISDRRSVVAEEGGWVVAPSGISVRVYDRS